MDPAFTQATVVITADQLNPSLVRESWLIKVGILKSPDELHDGFVFSDAMAVAKTDQFSLLVTPPRLQFSPADSLDSAEIAAILGKFVEQLPHTPFTGVGLNFHYGFPFTVEGVATESRQLFFRSDRVLDGHFDAPDANFGAYFSKNFGVFRLKLEVKPVELRPEVVRQLSSPKLTRGIAFDFNFHCELKDTDETTEQIRHALLQWNDARKEALSIISLTGYTPEVSR